MNADKMNGKLNGESSENYFLQPGYIFMTKKPTVISAVLGSGVAVCIYDRKRKVGGMNHFQFPYIPKKNQATARYGIVSALTLVRMMLQNGSKIKHLEAQILGGAHNCEDPNKNIGRENVAVARKVLSREKVPIVSEDIGGKKGRKVVFDTKTNDTIIMKVERLRTGDWYPYKEDRPTVFRH